MSETAEPAREGEEPQSATEGPVTLINGFHVAEGREEAFMTLWRTTSGFFRGQPGFLSLRLHRSLDPNAPHRFVNVARWASLEQFAAAHRQDEFKQLVAQPAWREFPNSPALYEEIVAHDG